MVHYEIPTSSQLTRYLYVYARFSIAANAGAMLKSDGERPAMDASTFARVTQVFRQSHGYATIADVSLLLLATSPSPLLVLTRRHLLVHDPSVARSRG